MSTNLLISAGHLPDTPLRWDDGKRVLAGYTDLRSSRRFRAGDVIPFPDLEGCIDKYVVRETSIVEPTNLTPLRVMASTDTHAHHLLSVCIHRTRPEFSIAGATDERRPRFHVEFPVELKSHPPEARPAKPGRS